MLGEQRFDCGAVFEESLCEMEAVATP